MISKYRTLAKDIIFQHYLGLNIVFAHLIGCANIWSGLDQVLNLIYQHEWELKKAIAEYAQCTQYVDEQQFWLEPYLSPCFIEVQVKDF